LGLFFVQIEIAIGIEIVLAVAFANVQRYRLARAQPLISGRPMDAIEDPGRLVHLGDVVDRKAVDVKLFVSKCHFFSISIAIPISIWIVQRLRAQRVHRCCAWLNILPDTKVHNVPESPLAVLKCFLCYLAHTIK
jgi:hypothetical protein